MAESLTWHFYASAKLGLLNTFSASERQDPKAPCRQIWLSWSRVTQAHYNFSKSHTPFVVGSRYPLGKVKSAGKLPTGISGLGNNQGRAG